MRLPRHTPQRSGRRWWIGECARPMQRCCGSQWREVGCDWRRGAARRRRARPFLVPSPQASCPLWLRPGAQHHLPNVAQGQVRHLRARGVVLGARGATAAAWWCSAGRGATAARRSRAHRVERLPELIAWSIFPLWLAVVPLVNLPFYLKHRFWLMSLHHTCATLGPCWLGAALATRAGQPPTPVQELGLGIVDEQRRCETFLLHAGSSTQWPSARARLCG